MKLSSIKTKEDFDNFSDNWYFRTKKLSFAMNDESKDYAYRLKASILFQIMANRMIAIKNIYQKQSVVNAVFPKGGV